MNIKNKQDLEAYFQKLIVPTKQYRQPDNGRLKLGTSAAHYDSDQAQIEGFLRTLWAVGPMAGNGDYDLKDFRYYINAITHSTDPDDKNYWGEVHDFDQLIVEMAALAVTLIETKAVFWDQLNPQEQDNLYNWLAQVNSIKVHSNNWRFFRILVNVAFIKLGRPFDQQHLTDDLELINSCYLKDGWYFDGNPQQMDYYIPWAFHYYGLLYAHYMKDEDPLNSGLFVERAKKFAQSFQYWFDDNGAGVPYGRSLTYRFAEGAFWSACVFTNVEVLTWSQIKYILLNHFSYWQAQPIQKNDGILSIGYGYENLYMSEQYNSPGSPYWGFKAFILLAVAEDHPFWKSTPQNPKRQNKLLIEPARMLLTNVDGQNVQLFPVGQWTAQNHAAEKYSKFVYSSRFGFSVTKGNLGLDQGAFDNCLAVAERGTEHYFSKEINLADEVTENYTQQTWSPFPKTIITSTIIPLGDWHVRVHEINTARSIEIADGGFSNKTFNGHADDYQLDDIQGGAAFTSKIGTIETINLYGFNQVHAIFSEANTNLIFPNSLYLAAIQSCAPGKHLLISAQFGGVNPANQVPTVSITDNQIIVNYQEQQVNLSKKIL